MSKNIIIQTKNLTKYYGKSRGIENLTFEVNKGEIYGLLGPNGAGKTTTIRVLLDFIRRTSGEAQVFGLDVKQHSTEIRRRTSYLPGDLGFYENKTARRNLEFLLKLYKKPVPNRRIEELAERIELALDRKVKELSKGNKQKVGIILTFALETELLIVDEPTSGLDPFITNEYYKILYEQQKESGTTVLLSSHLLGEVEKVAHRVGIIREGTIVEADTVANLKKLALKRINIKFPTTSEVQELNSKIPTEIANNIQISGTDISLTVSRDNLQEILDVIREVRNFSDLDIESPDLEEIFMKYYETGQSGAGSFKTSEIKNEESDQ
ncbi:MAG: ABC transporter ATP-binding protein [Promethearchaeota archaeon]